MNTPMSVVLNLTEREIQALAGLIDAGVRATGIRAVKDAANLVSKIEAAAAQSAQDLVVEQQTGASGEAVQNKMDA